MKNIDKKDKELIEEARHTAIKFSKETHFSHITGEKRKMTTVGAALRTKEGKIFTGPNIFHPCANPASLDAEYVVAAKAYSEGYKEFDTIVAYWHKDGKQKMIMPCGQCREFLKLFGDPWIIFPTKNGIKKEKVSKLLPY